jgi:hypothetical protein
VVGRSWRAPLTNSCGILIVIVIITSMSSLTTATPNLRCVCLIGNEKWDRVTSNVRDSLFYLIFDLIDENDG